MRRAVRVAGLVALVALEAWVWQQYAVRGTTWHWLLHSLTGLGAGLAVAAVVSAARGRAARPVRWAVAGQAVSIAPDVLFLVAALTHRTWMDVFLGHVAIHTAPWPLLAALALFVLAGWGWHLASTRPRAGIALAAVGVAAYAGALLLRDPVPSTLLEFRDAGAALVCDTAAARASSSGGD
jgi:hypothetical protein